MVVFVFLFDLFLLRHDHGVGGALGGGGGDFAVSLLLSFPRALLLFVSSFAWRRSRCIRGLIGGVAIVLCGGIVGILCFVRSSAAITFFLLFFPFVDCSLLGLLLLFLSSGRGCSCSGSLLLGTLFLRSGSSLFFGFLLFLFLSCRRTSSRDCCLLNLPRAQLLLLVAGVLFIILFLLLSLLLL